MLNRVKSILRAGRFSLTSRTSRVGLRFVNVLLGNRRENFFISFNSALIEDGLGAQLQRQLSIKALASFLGVNFIPVPLLQIAMHPLDDFKSTDDMKKFLTKVNEIFGFNNVVVDGSRKNYIVDILNIRTLLQFVIRLRLFRQSLHVTVAEVYSLVDSNPDMYLKALGDFQLNPQIYNFDQKLTQTDICIHYRQGVGGKAIYPGQKISRELDPEYFLSILNTMEANGKSISILTDAPEEDLRFYPHPSQSHLWVGTPGYKDGCVEIKGLKLREFFAKFGYEVQVISGGDLLSSLLLMIKCESLLMSRSSLSFVAGLLNKDGKIYYPPRFWHPPLENWIKVSEYAD